MSSLLQRVKKLERQRIRETRVFEYKIVTSKEESLELQRGFDDDENKELILIEVF